MKSRTYMHEKYADQKYISFDESKYGLVAVSSRAFAPYSNLYMHIKVNGIAFFELVDVDIFNVSFKLNDTEEVVPIEDYLALINALPGFNWQKVLIVRAERLDSSWVRNLAVMCNVAGCTLLPVVPSDTVRFVIENYLASVDAIENMPDRLAGPLLTLPGISNTIANGLIVQSGLPELFSEKFWSGLEDRWAVAQDVANWLK